MKSCKNKCQRLKNKSHPKSKSKILCPKCDGRLIVKIAQQGKK